jgi:hypothetical protein
LGHSQTVTKRDLHQRRGKSTADDFFESGHWRTGAQELDLDRTTIIAGLKIKIVRDAVREMARHDMNDCGWPVTSLADQMNISPTHAEWLSEILVEQKILERKPPPYGTKI